MPVTGTGLDSESLWLQAGLGGVPVVHRRGGSKRSSRQSSRQSSPRGGPAPSHHFRSMSTADLLSAMEDTVAPRAHSQGYYGIQEAPSLSSLLDAASETGGPTSAASSRPGKAEGSVGGSPSSSRCASERRGEGRLLELGPPAVPRGQLWRRISKTAWTASSATRRAQEHRKRPGTPPSPHWSDSEDLSDAPPTPGAWERQGARRSAGFGSFREREPAHANAPRDNELVAGGLYRKACTMPEASRPAAAERTRTRGAGTRHRSAFAAAALKRARGLHFTAGPVGGEAHCFEGARGPGEQGRGAGLGSVLEEGVEAGAGSEHDLAMTMTMTTALSIPALSLPLSLASSASTGRSTASSVGSAVREAPVPYLATSQGLAALVEASKVPALWEAHCDVLRRVWATAEPEEDPESSTALMDLPDEHIAQVLQRLERRSDWASCLLVSKRWAALACLALDMLALDPGAKVASAALPCALSSFPNITALHLPRDSLDAEGDPVLFSIAEQGQLLRSLSVDVFPGFNEREKARSAVGLEAIFQRCTSLQFLSLCTGRFVRALPDSLSCLQSLEVLAIDNRSTKLGLTALPPAIGALSSLKYLRLDSCWQLASLPDEVGDLASLEELELCSLDCLRWLPKALGRLPRLKRLGIYWCFSITELPRSLGHIQTLEDVTVNMAVSALWLGRLESLPESLGQLSALRSLRLIGCPKVTTLPSSVGLLTSLQELLIDPKGFSEDMESCGPLSLPDALCALPSLTSLELLNCFHLRKLPEGLGRLPRLACLRLSRCFSVAKLPRSLSRLASLVELLVDNKVDPETEGDDLAEGDEPKAEEDQVAPQPREDEEADGPNGLVELPPNMGSMVNLRVLCVRGNVALLRLPDGMQYLPHLQVLVLDFTEVNEAEAIRRKRHLSPFQDFRGQSKLWNQPESGPIARVSTEEEKGSGGLFELPEWIGRLKGLRRLDVIGAAHLRELPSTVGELEQLQRLVIARCRNLCRLPAEIGQLQALRILLVEDCPKLVHFPEALQSLPWLPVLCIDSKSVGGPLPPWLLQTLGFRRDSSLIRHIVFSDY